MTDEVAELVLADNRAQNALLGVGRAHARGHGPGAPAVRRGPRDPPRHRPAAGGAAGQGRVRRAGGGGAGADRSRAGDPRRAREARPARPRARLGPARHVGVLEPAARVLPAPAARAVPRGDRRPPAAPGDPHDSAGERDRRRRGHDVRVPHGRRAGRQPGRLGAGVLGRHRGVRPARAVGAPVLPADPHRGLGPGGARVAAAARPRRALVPHQPAPAPGRRLHHHPLRRAGAGVARHGCRSCWSGGSAPR